MTTGILVGLTIVLILAAAAVGMLLLQRRRPRTVEPAAREEPQTVGDLVRRRTTPDDDRSGEALFTPSAPRTGGVGTPATGRAADGSRPAPEGVEARTVQAPVPLPTSTPPTGEAGDAPWRRAARMMGAEPGAGWDTAPLPVVSEANGSEPTRRPDARRTVEVPLAGASVAAPVRASAAEPTVPAQAAGQPDAVDAPRAGSPAAQSPATESSATESSAESASSDAESSAGQSPAPVAAEPIAVEPAGAETRAATPAEPAAVPPAAPAPQPGARPAFAERITEPVALPVPGRPVAAMPGRVAPPAERPRPTPVRRTGSSTEGRPGVGSSPWILPEAVGAASEKPTAPLDRSGLDRSGSNGSGPNGSGPNGSGPNGSGPNGSTAQPAGSEGPSRPLSDPDLTPLMGIPIVRPFAADEPMPPPAVAESRATPPVPPTNRVVVDDEVVSMSPPPGRRSAPVVRTGSPQPVWFRVVRRDGEPVAGAVVALLDDHGHEVDATKTATDGGGELHTPHGGRFLMVTSAEGFQPRAVLLTVDGQPVELALLLPRSASVFGAVRSGTRLVAGARVVARQEGEIVDDLVTGRDGGYRFADLPEGSYVLSATDHRGSVVQQVRLSEGADVAFDLELVYREGAR